jgi:hypothetical protein
MKTRHFSFFSLATAYVLLTSASGIIGGVGCGGSSGLTGTGGTGGMGGMGADIMVEPDNLISNFEDIAAATVVMSGTPPRNGYWYPYNDNNPPGTSTCVQVPKSGPEVPAGETPPTYVGSPPPIPAPVTMGALMPGGLALRGTWMGCNIWGAGIGADLGQPALPDGGTYTGPKVPYDITAFKGVTFLAMAVAGTDTALRIKIPMTDETKVADGGLCVETTTHKCSDDWGSVFNLPSNGTWKRITVRWTDTTFKQEGWGAVYPWNPAHVTSIQIQSVDKVEAYDFYIDDMYFITN